MKLKLFHYPKCSTCRKAKSFLQQNKISFEEVDIKLHPPSSAELKQMLKLQDDELRRLFNTSGLEYRKLNLKERLPHMTQQEALELLTQNGMLIKRPFLLSKEVALLGFKEEQWKQNLIDD